MTSQYLLLVDEGFSRYLWSHDELGEVVVFHKEVFKLKWFAIKLVTFVFLIDKTPTDHEQIESNYNFLSAYARSKKKSIIPKGLQLGYALLPIYRGSKFSKNLIEDIKCKHRKKWCTFHMPSLFDMEANELITLETKIFWGIVYYSFIRDTIRKAVGVKGSYGAA